MHWALCVWAGSAPARAIVRLHCLSHARIICCPAWGVWSCLPWIPVPAQLRLLGSQAHTDWCIWPDKQYWRLVRAWTQTCTHLHQQQSPHRITPSTEQDNSETLHKYFINNQDQSQTLCCIRLMAKFSKMLMVHVENWQNSLGFQDQLGSGCWQLPYTYSAHRSAAWAQHWMPTESPYRLYHWLMLNLARSLASSHCILLSGAFLKEDGARISERKKIPAKKQREI